MIEFLLRVVVALVALALFGIVFLCWVGLAVGSANAWILQGTFSDGWDATWDRWVQSIGWSLLFLSGVSVFSEVRK